MKKVAILTHYHNSTNYGGVLQAYALCKAVSAMGYRCEQIDLEFDGKFKTLSDTSATKIHIPHILKAVYHRLLNLKNRKLLSMKNQIKLIYQKSFFDFNNNAIPHSLRCYSEENIKDAAALYDVFITGSDQVWNPIWYFEPFFLTFVPEGKKKFSYAASVSQNELSDTVKSLYSQHLKSFDAVSVREKSAVKLLSELTEKKVEHVLDPTLLLDKSDWESIASKKMPDMPYVFCYFLTNDAAMRQTAKDYAKKKGLILVNIKHATGNYHTNDIEYGDVSYDAPTPNEFLSLIRFADVVFTDSFHASVFSIIFEKQFFSFPRSHHNGMGSRIESLTELFDLKKRYLSSDESKTVEYISHQPDIIYPIKTCKYNDLKEKSLDYLRRNIE